MASDVFEDPAFEPRREVARGYGYQSVAVVPIAHEGTLYGLLGIYADRPGAFAGEERHVVDQIGGVIGHVIAATERKGALMSHEVVEVEFRVPDVFGPILPDAPTEGRIRLDRMVSLEDEEYLVYGTASAGAVEDLRALADRLPHWQSLWLLDEDVDGERRFELRLSEPPVLSAAASRGGSTGEAVAESGDCRTTVQFPPAVDVRRVESIAETHSGVDLVPRR